MIDEELVAWLRLTETPGIGPQTVCRLMAEFGLPEQVLSQNYSSLTTILSSKVALALLGEPQPALLDLIARTRDWLQQPGNLILTLADEAFPPTLLTIHDPPALLYVKGDSSLLARPALAMVGTRQPTAQGSLDAERFAKSLSEAGWTIVSGLAQGIDAAAHRGALLSRSGNVAHGSTVAVIGTGADIVYPAKNRDLAHDIAAHGCIVSDYPLGTPGIASNFPRRNRIISGLSKAVLVVEAALRSGSLITARVAAEQGRDVLAIPGSIHSPLSKGCHQLIKQGAKLVESAQDVLEELGEGSVSLPTVMPSAKKMQKRHPASPLRSDARITSADQPLDSPSLSARDDVLLQQVGFNPVTIDQLALSLQWDMADLQSALLLLEMNGHIERLPGSSVRRLA